MLPLYIPRSSPVHKLPAAYKLVACMAASTAICFVGPVWWLAGIAGAIGGCYALARLPFGALLTALRPILMAGVLIFAMQAVLADWLTATAVVLRFMSLVLLSALVSLTTPFSDMLEVLTRASRPLERFGASPPKIALAVALTIRFIPTLLRDMQEIQRARMARGARGPGILGLGPLIVKILAMTNALGDAIAARGFENRK